MRALFLDFDGVLHPSTEIMGKDLASLALRGADALIDAGLFRWTGVLEDELARCRGAADISIVVHSSWRDQPWLSSTLARDLLGRLGHRLEGFVAQHTPRATAISEFASRHSLQDILILDDAVHEFSNEPALVVTNPLLGVTEESTLARIRSWARDSARQPSRPLAYHS